MVKLKGVGNTYLIATSENKGPLKIFRNKNVTQKIIALEPDDKEIFITLKNGKIRKEELYLVILFYRNQQDFSASIILLKK